MKRKLIRHDVSNVTSAGLLIVAAIAIVTGLMSELWDLNDFVYHKYAGYALAVVVVIHVYLNWGRLAGYARWRLGRRRAVRRRPVVADASARFRQARPDNRGQGLVESSLAPSTVERPTWQGEARQIRVDSRPVTSFRANSEPGPESSRNRSRRVAAGSSPAPGMALRAALSRRGFVGLVLGGFAGYGLGRGLRRQPALPYGADVGTIYHEWSKPKLLGLLGAVADWGSQPALYKEHGQAQQIPLPSPGDFQGLCTEDAIRRRRSVRDYSGQPMTLSEFSQLLYYTGGINGERWGHRLRSAPSAGAMYPIEIYPVVHWVEGLERGLYHYAVRDHALKLLRVSDLRGEIVRHGLMQEFLGQTNLVLVFTAIFQRLRWKYQERAYRYALLEAGHLGQNVYLTATSMGMGACAVGAFLDDDLNAMLGVDGQHEAAIYMLSVGKV